MQTFGFNSYVTAHILAAEERQRACMADVALHRLMVRSGPKRPVLAPAFRVIRAGLGSALVRAGDRLAGTTDADRRSAALAAGR